MQLMISFVINGDFFLTSSVSQFKTIQKSHLLLFFFFSIIFYCKPVIAATFCYLYCCLNHSLDTNIQLGKLSCPWEAFDTELCTWCLLQARAPTHRSYYNVIGGNAILFCCIHSLDTNIDYLSCAASFLTPAASIATAHCVPKINWVFITVLVPKLWSERSFVIPGSISSTDKKFKIQMTCAPS